MKLPEQKLTITPLLLTTVLIWGATTAEAAGISDLKKGVYVADVVGCTGVGGAGEMTFDGKNFSGHYQVCRTDPIAAQPRQFQSTCAEGQGSHWPTLAQIDTDPHKTTAKVTLKVTSVQSFVMDHDSYHFCAPL